MFNRPVRMKVCTRPRSPITEECGGGVRVIQEAVGTLFVARNNPCDHRTVRCDVHGRERLST